jgi:hypothetical protein
MLCALEPGQGRVCDRATDHTAREKDQSANSGADEQDEGKEDDGRKYRVGRVGSGVLMQAPAEDEHIATDVCTAGHREVAAEDQNVAGHRTAYKNVSGEHAHATRGMSLNFGGTEKAARVMDRFVRCHQNVPAKVTEVGRGLSNTSQRWQQDQGAQNEAPEKHARVFLRNYRYSIIKALRRRSDKAVSGLLMR